MTHAWKKAFKDNRVDIVQGLANPDAVADYLFSDGMFTQDMQALVHVRYSVTEININMHIVYDVVKQLVYYFGKITCRV